MPDKKKLAIQNLLFKKEEWPKDLQPMLQRLSDSMAGYGEIEKAIAQAQSDLTQLMDKRMKSIGAAETLVDIISSAITDDVVEKYAVKE